MQTSTEFVRTYGAIVDALTATLMNAESGLNWLSAQPPDLEEVRRALNAIANDGKRAGEIVDQLRAPILHDDFHFRAAAKGKADIEHAQIGSVPIYDEYTPFCNGPDDVKPPE